MKSVPAELEAETGSIHAQSVRFANDLSDEEMEALGADAGRKAFHAAIVAGVKVAYLDGGEVKFRSSTDQKLGGRNET